MLGAPANAPVATTPRHRTVLLVGNPNTGKSTLFNALSGLRQRIGNYPGVTVEKKVGTFTVDQTTIDLVDLPGTYSLAARSPDELLTTRLLLGQEAGERRPDVIINIVDAANLERNLYLTSQLLETGIPVIVALNMIDQAERAGLKIDAVALAERLGVRVIPMQANAGLGVAALKSALAQDLLPPSRQVPFPEAVEQEVAHLAQFLSEATGAGNPRFIARRLLFDVQGEVERQFCREVTGEAKVQLQLSRDRLSKLNLGVPRVEARVRYAWIRDRLAGCVTQVPRTQPDWTSRIDAVLTHRMWGLVIFLLVMFLMFQSIFVWARPLMDLIISGKDWLANAISAWLAPGPLRSLLVQGILEGVGGVVVFLPQIMILFAFIAILEDCGYMARAAFLMDKVMARSGLSGKSFIPLLSSFACAIPGVMATRVIEDRRDRLATMVIAPLMSCSARLPVYLLLAGAFLSDFGWWVPGLAIFAMYLLGLLAAPLVALALKRTLLRGATPVFVLEMPAYQWPSWQLVIQRMFERGRAFVQRAGTVILASMVLIWALLYFPVTDPQGQNYDVRLAALDAEAEAIRLALAALQDIKTESSEHDAAAKTDEVSRLRAQLEAKEKQAKELLVEWKTSSWLGRLGRWIEPAVVPLGWDWRIGMAVLASFPAREVVVGTLGIVYSEGNIDPGEEEARVTLGSRLREATWNDETPRAGQPVFTTAVALSLMTFFSLCCQCVSTLAVIKRETNSWRWPLFTFTYMTLLAYLAALGVYQIGSRL